MDDNSKAKAKVDIKIQKWYDVKLTTYVIIYNLAVERFNDLITEVESVTDKSIKMGGGLLAFTGFLTGYLINKPNLINTHLFILIVSGIVVLLELILLTILLFPKKVKGKGISPENSIVKNIDNSEDLEYQEQLMYYNMVIATQENIDYILALNKKRNIFYKVAIILFIALIPSLCTVTVYVIMNLS